MSSLLLRLWLSVAIYRSLVKLTYGSLPSECRVSDQHKSSFYCNKINIDKVLPSIQSHATILEIYFSNQISLDLSFKTYVPLLISLKIVNGKLRRIKNRSLSELVHLEELSLENNELSHLEEDSLLGLLNLQILNLSGNKFVALDNLISILWHIGNLSSLDLSRNLIESISFENVEKLANHTIGKVDLSKCRVTRANPLTISYWSIHELHISDNPIAEECLKNISLGLRNSSVHILVALKLSSLKVGLNESLWPLYNSKIHTLIIGKTEFTSNLTFRSFVSLKELQIVDSDISGLDMDALLMLPNLESLQLNDNNIQHLYVKNITSNESNLKILDVSNGANTLVIPQSIFSRLSNLKELDLKRVMFGHTITRETFVRLQNLLKLKLADCSLKRVEDFALQNLRYLEILSFSRNNLQSLRNEMFVGLHNLTTLYLDNNALSFVDDPSPFSHLSNLEILILSQNNIKYLKPSCFSNLTNLNAVNLNDNSIVPWNASIVPEGGKLSFMLLRSNQLNIVTPAMLKDFDRLQTINLATNNFDCNDCSILKFQRWLLSTNVTVEELDNDNANTRYSCFSPYHLKGQSVLTAIVDEERCGLKKEKTLLLVVATSCVFLMMVAAGIISFKLRWHFRYCCYLLRSRVKRFREVQDSFSYEYDAFVSYDPADCDWIVHHLLSTLETSNSHIKFCLLDRDCAAGNDVIEEIFEVVQKCRKTLLVLSESYVKNQWCMFEMQMAQHSLFEEKRDSLILIQLQPMEEKVISANLAYLITTRTYIMWTDHPVGQKLFWKRLLAALAKPDTLRMPRIV